MKSTTPLNAFLPTLSALLTVANPTLTVFLNISGTGLLSSLPYRLILPGDSFSIYPLYLWLDNFISTIEDLYWGWFKSDSFDSDIESLSTPKWSIRDKLVTSCSTDWYFIFYSFWILRSS